jgi:hypothetical protein
MGQSSESGLPYFPCDRTDTGHPSFPCGFLFYVQSATEQISEGSPHGDTLPKITEWASFSEAASDNAHARDNAQLFSPDFHFLYFYVSRLQIALTVFHVCVMIPSMAGRPSIPFWG